MGVKRFIKNLGMNNNAFKQLFDKFKGSKFQNTDFPNFPLYFLKFPLYNENGTALPEEMQENSEFFFGGLLCIYTAPDKWAAFSSRNFKCWDRLVLNISVKIKLLVQDIENNE